jgi:hypothetical protein
MGPRPRQPGGSRAVQVQPARALRSAATAPPTPTPASRCKACLFTRAPPQPLGVRHSASAPRRRGGAAPLAAAGAAPRRPSSVTPAPFLRASPHCGTERGDRGGERDAEWLGRLLLQSQGVGQNSHSPSRPRLRQPSESLFDGSFGKRPLGPRRSPVRRGCVAHWAPRHGKSGPALGPATATRVARPAGQGAAAECKQRGLRCRWLTKGVGVAPSKQLCLAAFLLPARAWAPWRRRGRPSGLALGVRSVARSE